MVNERPDAQRNLLRTLDLYMRETPKLLPQTPRILQFLYNEDLVEEDIFLEYFPERKRNRNEFRLRAVRFIDWLMYAPVEDEKEKDCKNDEKQEESDDDDEDDKVDVYHGMEIFSRDKMRKHSHSYYVFDDMTDSGGGDVHYSMRRGKQIKMSKNASDNDLIDKI